MDETDDALRNALAAWCARNDALDAAFQEVRFGEDGYFQRAVSAVTIMLEAALTATPKKGEVGRAWLEVLPTLLRSEHTELTNERVERLIVQSTTDYGSFQELEYHSLNTTLLQHFPALAAWKQEVYLGAAKRPSKRGQHASGNFFRDRAICRAIEKLQALGFDPCRGDASPSTSACDVVSEALGVFGRSLSYSGVEKVWGEKKEPEYGVGGKQLLADLAELLALRSETNRL